MPNEPFTVEGNFGIVIPEATVISPDAFVILRGGVVVGKVSAEYDFSDLPSEYHAVVYSMIQLPVQIVWACDPIPMQSESDNIDTEQLTLWERICRRLQNVT